MVNIILLVIRTGWSAFGLMAELVLGAEEDPVKRKSSLVAMAAAMISVIAALSTVSIFREFITLRTDHAKRAEVISEMQYQHNARIRDLAAARYYAYKMLKVSHDKSNPGVAFEPPLGLRISLRPKEYTGDTELLLEYREVFEPNGNITFDDPGKK